MNPRIARDSPRSPPTANRHARKGERVFCPVRTEHPLGWPCLFSSRKGVILKGGPAVCGAPAESRSDTSRHHPAPRCEATLSSPPTGAFYCRKREAAAGSEWTHLLSTSSTRPRRRKPPREPGDSFPRESLTRDGDNVRMHSATQLRTKEDGQRHHLRTKSWTDWENCRSSLPAESSPLWTPLFLSRHSSTVRPLRRRTAEGRTSTARPLRGHFGAERTGHAQLGSKYPGLEQPDSPQLERPSPRRSPHECGPCHAVCRQTFNRPTRRGGSTQPICRIGRMEIPANPGYPPNVGGTFRLLHR
jgi:hypothetical protein